MKYSSLFVYVVNSDVRFSALSWMARNKFLFYFFWNLPNETGRIAKRLSKDIIEKPFALQVSVHVYLKAIINLYSRGRYWWGREG